jgi:hypothetical protein
LNSVEATTNQFTTFVTVGVTDRFDVSLALPIVSSSLTVVSNATIQRLGTTNPLTHFFRQADGTVGNTRTFTAIGDASGIGDVTVRLKTLVGKGKSGAMAVGVDVRLPTGDAMNLLGTGAVGVQPFVILSTTMQRVSPHFNLAYQWNGPSVLAGNPATGESADFPDQAAYAAGADVAVNPHLTLAFDLLCLYVMNAERIHPQDFHALDGVSVFRDIGFSPSSFNVLSGSLGMKLQIVERLLLDANVLFALDNHGVRDKVTPLVGFELSF